MLEAEAGNPMSGVMGEYTPFGDVVQELADWTIRDDSEQTDLEIENLEVEEIAETLRQLSPVRELAAVDNSADTHRLQVSHHESFTNPYRYVGRNDPCPCGSGKKFKRCCGQWK